MQDTVTNRKNSRPWVLAENTLETVRESQYQMAILPLGATEPHNLHLPYATDIYEAEWIASEIAKGAWEQGARPVVLPTIPYGTETNMQRFPLAMNIMPSTTTGEVSKRPARAG